MDTLLYFIPYFFVSWGSLFYICKFASVKVAPKYIFIISAASTITFFIGSNGLSLVLSILIAAGFLFYFSKAKKFSKLLFVAIASKVTTVVILAAIVIPLGASGFLDNL